MTPDDLAQLHGKAFQSTRGWTAQEFADLLRQKTVHLCGDARCFMLIRVVVDEAEILTIATDPNHLRQGLATNTLAEGENIAIKCGAASIFLEVAEDNIAARGLYGKHGYKQVGTRPGYYMPKEGAAITAFVLRKDLLAT